MANPTERFKVLDRNTLIPAGAVAGAFVTLFSCWIYLDSRFARIEVLQRDSARSISELRKEVTDDSWSRTDHRLWVADLRRMNPSMPVPPVGKSE